MRSTRLLLLASMVAASVLALCGGKAEDTCSPAGGSCMSPSGPGPCYGCFDHSYNCPSTSPFGPEACCFAHCDTCGTAACRVPDAGGDGATD